MTRPSVKSILAARRHDVTSWTVTADFYGDKVLIYATPRDGGRAFIKTVKSEYYLKLLRND